MIKTYLVTFLPLLAFAQPPGGGSGGGSGGGGGGTTSCTNPTCSSPPCAASLRGDVGCTTVSGTVAYSADLLTKGDAIPANTHIYGPFEAGFGETQKNILKGFGCTDDNVESAYDTVGGTDVDIAEKKIAAACNLVMPRIEGDNYYGLVGSCGGHTSDYHFHKSFSCLYDESASGHSAKIGVVGSWNLYGKWEDTGVLPELDACGCHFGVTPNSNGQSVYHCHVQDKAPFTIGCHGPSATGGLVDVATCRSLYSECGDKEETFTISGVSYKYDRDCPCFDGAGLNTGTITPLAALSSSSSSSSSSSDTTSTVTSTPTPTPTNTSTSTSTNTVACTDGGYCNDHGIAVAPTDANTSGACFCECISGWSGTQCTVYSHNVSPATSCKLNFLACLTGLIVATMTLFA
eukprot:g439.t1